MSFARRQLISFALALMTAGVAPLAAQAKPQSQPATQAQPTSGGARIAFVNAGALLKGMPGYAQAESTFAKEADATKVEAQKLRAPFDSAVAQYQQSQAMMTPSNRTAREKQLQVQQDSLQAKLQALENKMQSRQRDLLSPMQDRLRAIIEGFRAEGNYAMIIDLASEVSQNIISYDKSLDITLRVAQRLAQSPSN